jgi:hypothetical protein
MSVTRKLLIAVVAIGLAALLAGVAIDASGSANRMAGSNLIGQIVVVRDGRAVRDVQPVAKLPPGARLCQAWTVPADTSAVRVRIFTSAPAAPPLAAEIVSGGRTVSSGALPAGPARELATIPITRVRRSLLDAQICIVNRGPSAVSLGGAATPQNQAVRVNGVPQGGLVRFDFLRPGSESWWQLLPTVVHRFGLAKSHWLGAWTFFLTGLLVVLAVGLAVRTLLREETT